jgi:hypothetical protein
LRPRVASLEALVLLVCAFTVVLLGLFSSGEPGRLSSILALECARERARLLF